MRQRRVSRRRKSPFPALFLGVLFIVASAFLVWKIWYTPEGVDRSTDILPTGTPFLIRINESGFLGSPTTKILEGESLRSKEKMGLTLRFFEGSTLTLDANTEIMLTNVREDADREKQNIEVEVVTGRVWAEITRKKNVKSFFALRHKDISLRSTGGVFSFSPTDISVISGMVRTNTPEFSLEAGQRLSKKNGEWEKMILPISFQTSDWFLWNDANEKKPPVIASPSENIPPSKIEVPLETDTSKEEGIVLQQPGKNGEVVTIVSESVILSGTVPAGTETVIVNDYALSKFQKGDRKFSYRASKEWENLENGRNEYVIVALGNNGQRWETNITLLLSEENTKKENQSSKKKPIAEKTIPAITGKLTIRSPKEGDTLSEDTIVVTGSAPSNATKIVVNDYELSAFRAGDTSWKYIIRDNIGNREVGLKTVTAVAFDTSGEKIASTSVSFEISPLSTKIKKSAEGELEKRPDYLPPVPQNEDGSPTI